MKMSLSILIQSIYKGDEKMKICIDGIGVSRLKGTGLCTYTYEMIDSLYEIYPQPEYEIICEDLEFIKQIKKRTKTSYLSLEVNRKENDYSIIEKYLTENKVNLFHSPNNGFSIPYGEAPKNKCRYVITVHDVIAFSNPQFVDVKYKEKFTKIFPNVVERSDKIIATSNHVKNELIQLLKIPSEKIEVIYPGCSQQFKHIEYDKCKEFLRENFNIEGEIILFAGSIHPRKNLDILCRVFKEVLNHYKELKLAIVGKIDGKRREYYLYIKQLVEELGIKNNVIFTGNVDYKYMPFFYNAAKCCINISSYEGFPITTLESLCCGTPVICSRIPVFKEVVSDYAVLVNLKDEEEIKDAIFDTLLNNRYKNKLSEESKIIKEKFSWTKAAKKHVSLYETLIFG